MERKTYTFNIDAPECQACSYYTDCKNKRRVACMYLEPLSNPAAASVTRPIIADIAVKHDFQDIKIGENTTITIDLEEMKKKMVEEFNKAIGCALMEG